MAAAQVEKEKGNCAFKALQYGEALGFYSRAIEHHRGDLGRRASTIGGKNLLGLLWEHHRGDCGAALVPLAARVDSEYYDSVVDVMFSSRKPPRGYPHGCPLYLAGDKSIYTNRSLVHIKLRNFLSAVEDASRAIEISTYLDEDSARYGG